MNTIYTNLKPLKAIVLCFVTLILIFSDNNHSFAQTDNLDTLLVELQNPENKDWEKTEDKIRQLWMRSGSVATDHLLQRGIRAMEKGHLRIAIFHFSAAIDHAPDFAEAWNKRATVYFMMEKLGPSMSDIQKTLILNPNHFGAMGGLGAILEKLDRNPQALAVYQHARKIHPHLDGFKDAILRLKTKLNGTSL